MRVARQLQRTEGVDLEDVAPFLLAVIGRRAGQVAARVVDEDVQAIAEILHPVEHGATILRIGDIGGEGMRLAVGHFDLQLLAHGLERRFIARHHQHRRAETHQFGGDGAADACAGAGHQCQLSVQSPALRVHGRSRDALHLG